MFVLHVGVHHEVDKLFRSYPSKGKEEGRGVLRLLGERCLLLLMRVVLLFVIGLLRTSQKF